MSNRIEFPLVMATEEAAITFVRTLDAQIDEVEDKLQRLQMVRRSTAETFGIDRRVDAGRFGAARDNAARAQYEGEGSPKNAEGKLMPHGDGDHL